MSFENSADAVQNKMKALDGKWKTALRMVDIRLICPNPYLPLEKAPENLADIVHSLRNEGLTSPLTVRAIGTLQKPLFQLISGEERLRACLYAELQSVPCIIIDADADHISYLDEISLPRNFFEEIDMIYEIFSNNRVSLSDFAKYFDISPTEFEKRLSLREFSKEDRKIILDAGISLEHTIRLHRLDHRTKNEVLRAMENGVHGRSAEDLIFNLSESGFQTRIYIKHAGLFFNSVDKAVATMNRSGVPVKCTREEKKTFTRLVITVPKRS